MDPNIWGPHLWYVLHIITLTYPIEPTEYDKRMYHDFFTNLKEVLPCDICKKHYSKFISQYPITPHLSKREHLVKWLIQIHNFVNLELGKPVLEVTGVLELYKNLKPISPFHPNNIATESIAYNKYVNDTTLTRLKIIIVILLIVIIVIKAYYWRNYYNL